MAKAKKHTKLNAETLKDTLWETLRLLRDDKISGDSAVAIAKQSKEILRIIKMQVTISKETKREIPEAVIKFSEDTI